MIDLSFSVRNPFHNEKKNPWRDLYQGEWLIGKNTALEIGFFKFFFGKKKFIHKSVTAF
jgi:hypothetical protein